MTRLSKKDNDTLRKQEWQLLFGPNTLHFTQGTSASASASILTFQQECLPPDYAQDTFLVKTFFSETEKYYLILLTNLKQSWFERLEIEDIRKRSQNIKSFAYEEDSQLEALLVSLSAIFQETGSTSSSTVTERHIKHMGEKLSLFVGFVYGIASVQWEFKLSPLLQVAGNAHPNRVEEDSSSAGHHLASLLHQGKTNKKARSTAQRVMNFLEDSDLEDENDGSHADKDMDKEISPQVDGTSVLYDHLILPLISLTNAYRKQTRALETVIKSKEIEIFEALEMMEQSGVGYHNRRRATERYDKAKSETKLQEDIAHLVRPQTIEPKELFSDKKVAMLCSIVAKNAEEKDPSLPSQDFDAMTQDQLSASQSSLRGSNRRAGAAESAATLTIPVESAAGPEDNNTTSGAEGSRGKSSKRAEELERRRLLQERLDREQAEKARAPKKKRLL
ncbi:hypothetical protein BGX28_001812 [Mortierella sp. GBA30]|nr:hypothetical protein BGX28_001812 [Mortierella sp. GBA30]